jgi:tight adherence protein B
MIHPSLILVSISLIVLSLAVFSLIWWAIGNGQRFDRRLTNITGGEDSKPDDLASILEDKDLSSIPLLNRQLHKIMIIQNLRKLLITANISIKASVFILIMFILGVLGFLITYRTENVILILFSVTIFGFLPLLAVLRIRNKRLRMFEQQFPDALDMMRSAIRAGLGLHRSVQLVGNESPDPIGIEFQKTSEEINLGIPWKDALNNLNNRIESTDVSLFVAALIIQRESGGNLNEILSKLSQTIRERFKLAGQLKVVTAQGRLSQLVLGLLPVAFGLFVWLINPEYINILFTSELGHKFLLVAIALQILGNLSIYRIIKIKH